MNRILGLTVAATLALGAAAAQADDNRGFYVGVNIGATSWISTRTRTMPRCPMR